MSNNCFRDLDRSDVDVAPVKKQNGKKSKTNNTKGQTKSRTQLKSDIILKSIARSCERVNNVDRSFNKSSISKPILSI